MFSDLMSSLLILSLLKLSKTRLIAAGESDIGLKSEDILVFGSAEEIPERHEIDAEGDLGESDNHLEVCQILKPEP